MEWNVGTNPCPHGKPYLMEDGNCYRCPAYQECVSAVEIRDRNDNDEDRDCWDADDDEGDYNGEWDYVDEW